MKKAGKITAVILMGLVILFNILTAVINVAGKSAEYRWLPFAFLTVETGSMEPELSVGDLVITKDVPYEEIQVGDTITFRQVDSFITHKVIRKEGSRLVTKGTANNVEDKSIGPDDYYGKVVASIPMLGKVLVLFGSPITLICMAVLLFGLFYGRNFINWIEAKTEKRDEKFSGGSVVKLFGLILAVSILILTPTMTEAKYAAQINARAALAADYRYFTSNFMTEQQSPFIITGWSGNSFGMTVTVKNSENRLKHNKSGQDIIYKFIALKIAQDGETQYSTEYELNVEEQGGVVYASEEAEEAFKYHPDIAAEIEAAGDDVIELGPFVLAGADDSITVDSFDMMVTSDALNPLLAGESIRYKLYAVSSYDDGYYLNLSSDMTMQVSDQKNFIEALIKSTNKGSALMTLDIRTGLMDGSGTKNVKVTWDNTQVYLNEYEKNAFEIIRNRDASYYYAGTYSDHDAYLIVPLTAYSEVQLQFFKYDLNDEIDDITIDAIVDNVEEE